MFPVHLIFRLLFFTVHAADSSSSMIVTWGRPSNYSRFTTLITGSWRSCVTYCYKLKTCVLTSSPVNPINCQVFTTNEIWTVQKLSLNSEVMVAFKVENFQDSCPVGENAPTFNNVTAQGTSSSAVSNFSHKITFKGDTWILSYQQVVLTTKAPLTTKRVVTTTKKVVPTTKSSGCATGWTTFKRPKTIWCLKIIMARDKTYTQDQAISLCAQNNAILSGLETQEERTFVATTGVSFLGANYPNWAALWISGVRKSECSQKNWPQIAYCNNTIQQFTYSDPYLTNYAGVTWESNQPDRDGSGVWQNCMCIWLRLPAASSLQFQNGAVDDIQCDLALTQWFALRGVVCGKLPDK